jgi:hypothetical protein
VSYRRVIPRDLFNEGSLLKCYGRLAILLDQYGASGFAFPEDVTEFDIVQRPEDGAIFIANLPLSNGKVEYHLLRPLNSRRAWPLYAANANDDSADWIEVFNDDGYLTAEMRELIL